MSSSKPLTAFVNFPSPYTQTLLVKALVRILSSISITLIPPVEGDIPPQLQWADYDLISWEYPRANPSTHLTSSYIYRKALIRKHQLHRTIIEYLAKCDYREYESILAKRGYPKGWNIEIQFADELDEALLDDLYDLSEILHANEEEGLSSKGKRWFILKPGFADRAQGIRLFSTEDELRRIFESFEPESEDDEEEVGSEEDLEDDLDKLQVDGEEEESDQGGTGVQTSQMRHFVIQEYAADPILFDIAQTPHTPMSDPQGYKFHIRAYVLLVGAYQVYLSHTMLALFSGTPYSHPTSSVLGDYNDPELVDENLRPHLTNTCLQTDAMGSPVVPGELVKLFWELEGLDTLSLDSKGDGYTSRGRVDRQWLDQTFSRVGEVVREAVKAGAECGSFGLQLLPNAFEIFGVDLLCSFPSDATSSEGLPIPTVSLLEFNASPDFHQSGDRLSKDLLELFEGVIKIAVLPFFGLESTENQQGQKDENASKWKQGESRYNWTLIGQSELRTF